MVSKHQRSSWHQFPRLSRRTPAPCFSSVLQSHLNLKIHQILQSPSSRQKHELSCDTRVFHICKTLGAALLTITSIVTSARDKEIEICRSTDAQSGVFRPSPIRSILQWKYSRDALVNLPEALDWSWLSSSYNQLAERRTPHCPSHIKPNSHTLPPSVRNWGHFHLDAESNDLYSFGSLLEQDLVYSSAPWWPTSRAQFFET